MALHWEHIKGFNGDAATGSSITAGTLYTYIEYQKGPKSASPVSNVDETLLPNILVSSQNIQGDVYENDALKSGIYSCGHIVTTDITNTFNNSQQFFKPVFIHDHTSSYANQGICLYRSNYIYSADGIDQSQIARLILSNSSGSSGDTYLNNFHKDIWLINGNDNNASLTATVHLHQDYVEIGIEDWTSPCNLKVWGSATINDYCQALYFNAVSDVRAKENITPLTQNMLDIVNKIQVYTFNYKSHPSQRSIGLIAQDLKDINIDGFSLVENPNATGEDGNYMSIHESKLVYILLEAVKELSAKVDKLEEQLYGSK